MIGRTAFASRPPALTVSRAHPALATLVAALVAFGVVLRCYHVDARVLWDDEIIATMHVLGMTESEFVRRAPTFATLGDMRDALHAAGPLRSPAATITALASEDPQHSPLFYLIAREWAGVFGDSRAALRMLSATIALTALPCMYWLCRELFGSPRAGWIGTAAIAVSPVAVVYAHEMSEYALWLTATLVVSALLVRAIRQPTRAAWSAYGLMLGIGLYVFPLTALVAVAHLVTVLAVVPPGRARIGPVTAVVVGCALYVPWLTVLFNHVGQIGKGMATIVVAHTTPLDVARMLAHAVSLTAIDINAAHQLAAMAAALPALAVIGYAVYALRTTHAGLAQSFIWSVLACTSLPIVLLDIVLGGARTGNVRYFIPAFVAVDLALVALVLAALNGLRPARVSRMLLAAFGVVVAGRVASCALIAQSTSWWSDYNKRTIEVARLVSAAQHPVVVGDDYIVWALGLAEYANPRIPVVLRPRCYLCDEPAASPRRPLIAASSAAATLVLLAPSKELQSEVRTDVPHAKVICIDVRDTCEGDRLDLW